MVKSKFCFQFQAIQYCQIPQLPLNIMTFHFIKPLIITARENGIIEVWDLNTGEQVSQTMLFAVY
jgi:hypothetical protein